jgi:hemoglobin/transferrin/lactoferrin receptor protein
MLASLPLLAQQSADSDLRFVLSGRVVDANGAALPGANVNLRQNSGGFERTVTTDANGAFTFTDLARGQYRITAANMGFSDVTEEIALSANTQPIELTIRPGTISEKVTITATRAETLIGDTPVPVSVVEQGELERRGLNTIGDVFRDLPGVSTTNEGPFQVRPRIRGLDSNRVLILVDGERLNNTRTSTANSGIEIGLVDIDQVERVEVARGSGSVLYGTDALAGTINIITRDTPARQESGFKFGGGFNGFFSSNETGRRGSAYLTGAGSRFAFRISQTLDRFDNYHTGPVPRADGSEDASSQATEVVNSQYHGSNTQLVGRFFIDDSQSIKASYERRRAGNIGVPGAFGVFTAFFPFSNRDKVSGRYEAQYLLPHLSWLTVSTYYQKQDRNFSNILSVPAAPPFFPGQFQFSETNTKTTTAGFDAQSNWTLGLRNVLTVGASYLRDHNRDSRFIERLSPNFRTNPPSLTRSEDRSKSVPDATFANLAFFAQDEYEVSRKLRFIGGVRFDRFNTTSERTPGFDLPTALFTPSQIEDLNLTGLDTGLQVRDRAVSGDFGVVYKPIESLSFTARVGRSFREPNLFERFFTDFGSAAGFVVGNPDLEAESGVNVDTGIAVRVSRFRGSFNYFNNTYTNFLTSEIATDRNNVPITVSQGPGRPPIQVFRTVNVGHVRIQGVEGEVETSLRAGDSFITPFGNISYLRGNDLDLDVPLDFITPLKTVAGARWQDRRERLWSEWRTRIVNGQDRLSPEFIAANGGTEPGYVTHSLRAGYNFRRESYTFGFSAGVDNLLNRFYSEQFVSAPARGRSATFGINLRFF